MVDQLVPNVITLRDFGDAQVVLVLSILDEFGKQDWNRPDPRVRLAILKLANGNLDRLLDETETAIEDYRVVLSEAEYPRYSREIGFGDDAESVQRAVIDDDWRQYREWLERGPT